MNQYTKNSHNKKRFILKVILILTLILTVSMCIECIFSEQLINRIMSVLEKAMMGLFSATFAWLCSRKEFMNPRTKKVSFWPDILFRIIKACRLFYRNSFLVYSAVLILFVYLSLAISLCKPYENISWYSLEISSFIIHNFDLKKEEKRDEYSKLESDYEIVEGDFNIGEDKAKGDDRTIFDSEIYFDYMTDIDWENQVEINWMVLKKVMELENEKKSNVFDEYAPNNIKNIVVEIDLYYREVNENISYTELEDIIYEISRIYEMYPDYKLAMKLYRYSYAMSMLKNDNCEIQDCQKSIYYLLEALKFESISTEEKKRILLMVSNQYRNLYLLSKSGYQNEKFEKLYIAFEFAADYTL